MKKEWVKMNLASSIKDKTKVIRNDKALVIFSFLFFLLMMLFNLTNSALWGDELVEYYYSQKAIQTGELYNAIIYTYQPPLYNFIMHFWLKISGSLFWFRFFNVILGTISFWFLYSTLKNLVGCRKACVSSIILAVCYQWIYCIQECSEYALMLCALFMTLYFYVMCLECFSYAKMIGFVLSCVMAVYSQYGAVFVIVPLLCLFFCKIIFGNEHSQKRKMIIIAVYIFSFFAFALPLYIFFAKIQIKHHAIAENSIQFTADLLKDIPFIIGKIFAWFFNVNDVDTASIIFGIFGLIFLSIIINCLICKSENWIKRSLLLCMLITYVMHYVLVELHIYAMVHPGQSSGFYCRYSYFYIPLMAIVVPIIYDQLEKSLNKYQILRLACVLLTGTVLFVSFIGTVQNWHKSYVDQISKFWLDNKGWEDATYLFGDVSHWGISFYAGGSSKCPDNCLDKVYESVDNDILPDRFWAWANDWKTDGWEVTVDRAKELGYVVEIYANYGDKGKLSFCHKNN